MRRLPHHSYNLLDVNACMYIHKLLSKNHTIFTCCHLCCWSLCQLKPNFSEIGENFISQPSRLQFKARRDGWKGRVVLCVSRCFVRSVLRVVWFVSRVSHFVNARRCVAHAF